MTKINPRPEPYTNPPSSIKPYKDETLKSWLARKLHVRNVYNWERGK